MADPNTSLAVVTSTLPTWGIVGLLVVGLAAMLPVILALLYMGQWVGRIDNRATNAEKAAELARERAHDLANQLASFKTEASRMYVLTGAFEKSEERLMAAIEAIGTRLDRLFTRSSS